jgi:hypothetical protein
MKKSIIARISALIFTMFATLFIACDVEEDAPAPASDNPTITEITPTLAPANTVLTLKGSGLGDIRSITFEKENIPATVVSTFNTEEALIFRVPINAVPGVQKIIFKNGKGKEFKADFNVLGFAAITEVSNYNFKSGEDLILTGKNLDDVVKVTLTGTTTEATVKAKTATALTITMPVTDLNETKLTIENGAGSATTTQEFVNIDKAYQIFTDSYQNGHQDASWGSGGTISTTVFKSGTASVYKDYAAGNWHQLGFGWNFINNDGYKYLSFWIKGGTKDMELFISTGSSPSGFASFDEFSKIAVPANVWTYFKIPVTTLKIWGNNNATAWQQIGWRIKGPDGADERFYLDDIILVK